MNAILKLEFPKCSYQEPEDKYFKLCNYHAHCYHYREEVTAYNWEINKDGFVWIKLYLWIIKSEFYIISFVTKCALISSIIQTFKTPKILQKQAKN